MVDSLPRSVPPISLRLGRDNRIEQHRCLFSPSSPSEGQEGWRRDETKSDWGVAAAKRDISQEGRTRDECDSGAGEGRITTTDSAVKGEADAGPAAFLAGRRRE